jgi:NADPH:quinone reductase
MFSVMKAAFITETGSPDVIQFGDIPEPSLGSGQVLIRVEAVAVNPIDTYIRSGVVAMDLPMPFVIGCDAAGSIEAVGEGVTGFKAGDLVWCTNQGLLGRQGTFAEKIVVDSQWCFHRSGNVTAADAAASALVGVTAHLGLFRDAARFFPSLCAATAGMSQPEPPTILVIGGSGGVGSMVVQMAKIEGATVIATAGSAAKCERLALIMSSIIENNQSLMKSNESLPKEYTCFGKRAENRISIWQLR